MNFQITPVLTPLRVLVVNPLTSASQMVVMRVMHGEVFGEEQLIDLTLLVYSNERSKAEIYRMELLSCAFIAMNAITITSDLPNFSDADVFLFISTLKNPNSIDFGNSDDDQFDALYLILKIANNLRIPEPVRVEEQVEKPEKIKHGFRESPEKPKKPIIMADGLVTLSILYNFSHNLPSDLFFCPTPLGPIAKSILGDYVKIRCNEINNVLIWAADDDVFHVEIDRPFFLNDRKPTGKHCDWAGASEEFLKSVDLDHVQFNDSWMKKDFVDKVAIMASKNPYGAIYKAAKYSIALSHIYELRSDTTGKELRKSMGVISDGSFDTYKGCAYVLPLIFKGEDWSVNHTLEELAHVRQEIKRINKRAKEKQRALKKYCKKFLEDNIINQAFIPKDDESGSLYSFHSSRLTSTGSQ